MRGEAHAGREAEGEEREMGQRIRPRATGKVFFHSFLIYFYTKTKTIFYTRFKILFHTIKF